MKAARARCATPSSTSCANRARWTALWRSTSDRGPPSRSARRTSCRIRAEKSPPKDRGELRFGGVAVFHTTILRVVSGSKHPAFGEVSRSGKEPSEFDKGRLDKHFGCRCARRPVENHSPRRHGGHGV